MCSEEESDLNQELQTDVNKNLTRSESHCGNEFLIQHFCKFYDYNHAYIKRLEENSEELAKQCNQSKEEQFEFECKYRTLKEENLIIKTRIKWLEKELQKTKADNERKDKFIDSQRKRESDLEDEKNCLKGQVTRLSTKLHNTTTDNTSNSAILIFKSKDQISKTGLDHLEENENGLKEGIDQTKADNESYLDIVTLESKDQTCHQKLIPFEEKEVKDPKQTDNGSNPDIVKTESKDQASQQEFIPFEQKEVIDTKRTDDKSEQTILKLEGDDHTHEQDLDLLDRDRNSLREKLDKIQEIKKGYEDSLTVNYFHGPNIVVPGSSKDISFQFGNQGTMFKSAEKVYQYPLPIAN